MNTKIQQFVGRKLHDIRVDGLLKVVLTILVVLCANGATAQINFASAQVLGGDFGTVSNSNFGVIHDPNAPNIAGFRPNAPLWYQWTASHSGVVGIWTPLAA